MWSSKLDQGHSVKHTTCEPVHGIDEAIIFFSVRMLMSHSFAVNGSIFLAGFSPSLDTRLRLVVK